MQDYFGLSDVCFSLPSVVNRRGIERVLPLQLDERELAALRHSAEVIKTSIAGLELEKIQNVA